MLCLFIGAKVYYTLKNKYVFVLCCKVTDMLMKISQRDKIWDAMTREEKLNYLATTKDKGNKRYVLGALVDMMALIKDIDLISDLLLKFSNQPLVKRRWGVADRFTFMGGDKRRLLTGAPTLVAFASPDQAFPHAWK